MATVLTEGFHDSEFLVSEANGGLSREVVTVTVYADFTYPAGLPLAMITATGKYVPVDLTAADGSENAVAILLHELVEVTGSNTDMDGVVIARLSEVNYSEISWKLYDLSGNSGLFDDMTAGNITTARGDLATVDIIVRDVA